MGANPKLPNVVHDKLPALEGVTTSESVFKHLQCLHTARREYIKSESFERIRRALRHKVRAAEKIYQHGEMCYYKRAENRWRGPAKVIGNDGNTYVLLHQGRSILVSVNRMISVEDAEQSNIDLEDVNEDSQSRL